MKKILSASLLISLYLITGCGSKQTEYDPTIAPAKTTSTIMADSTSPAAALNLPVPVNQAIPTPVITTTNKSEPVKTAAGMNPPHGQPGHRCDLAVGAPLNSKPNPQPEVKTIASSPVPNITTTPLKTNPTPTKNAAGVRLNPAHGQPGHDCSIAVGQPLKS